ncbi:response regulator transcription factor [Micromonospora sp. CPCC 205561]|uniref:response regulator transcription factor n=1 Tax=Micromonospora sp. CPCC 205561 TaxID=3122407 RepID=UPI002FEE9900
MICRVGVVDDRSVTFRGVAEVLRASAGIRFLGVFATLDECAAQADGGEPTVVVTDPFPGPGLPARPFGHLALLVMSASRRPADVRAALGRGVGGYICKGADVGTLFRAIAAVSAGDVYLDGELRTALAADGQPDPGRAQEPRPPAEPTAMTRSLTPRERDVLRLVAEGLTHKQIGARLELSKATVDTYVHRVRQKTGMPNKAGLTRIAMELQLTAPAA